MSYTPEQIAILEQGYGSSAPAPMPKPKGRSGWAKWLPTAGAVAGTLALAPFTGGASLLGTAALLGGGAAIGGGLGELGGQKFSHEKTNWGNVGKEAGLSGVLGAIPIGGAAKAARVARGALKEGADSQVSKGFLTRARENMALHGQQMQARSGGFSVNAKVPGSRELDITGSKRIGQTLKDEGINKGGPLRKLDSLETKLKGHGSQMDSIISGNNVKIMKADRQAIADHYLRQVEKLPGVDDTVRSHAQNIAKNYVKNGGTDAKGLVNFRRGLDRDHISYIANPDAALAGKQQAAKVARQVLSSTTERLVPGIKEANQAYSKAITAKGYLVKGTGEMNARGGIVGRIAESGPIKTAEDAIGRLAQKAAPKDQVTRGGLLGKFTKGAVIKESAKQAIPRIYSGDLAPFPAQDAQPPAPSGTDEQALKQLDPNTSLDSLGSGGGQGTAADDLQAQLIEAAKQALANGDTKGLANITNFASMLQSMQPKTKKLSSTDRQQGSLATQGLQGIDSLEKMISENPSLIAKTAVPGRGILGLGNRFLGLGEYQSQANQVLDAVARLRTGAAMTKSEETFYQRMLPQPSDSPQTIKAKLGELRNYFQTVMPGENNTFTLQDALAGAQ